MAVTANDITELGQLLFVPDYVAEAILRALPIPDVQGAGHSNFVINVRKELERKHGPHTSTDLQQG